MPESRAEVVMATLRERLAAILADAGATAWYTPSKVARIQGVQEAKLDDSLTVLYLMVPDRSERARANTCTMGVDLHFDLVLAKRFKGTGQQWQDEEEQDRIRKRMAKDATDVLESNETLFALQTAGVNASEVTIADDIGSPEETAVPGWAVAFLGVLVRYRYPAGAFGVAS